MTKDLEVCEACGGHGRCPCRTTESGFVMDCPKGEHRGGYCPECRGCGRRDRTKTKLGDNPALRAMLEKAKT